MSTRTAVEHVITPENLNYLRDMVSKGVVRLLHVPGDENHADALTKDLNYEKFSKFARVLMHGHQ